MHHMKFGEADLEGIKELQLIRVAECYGEGAIFFAYRDVPRILVEFIHQQYKRYRIPLTHDIEEYMPVLAGALSLELVDYYDPYSLFWDFSDVSYTNEWLNYAYDIRLAGGSIVECEPELIETYRFIPGQAEWFFNEHIVKPGLKSLPPELRSLPPDVIRDYQEGHHYPHGLYFNHAFPCNEEVNDMLDKACLNEDGSVNLAKQWAYWDISMWSGMMWLLGPLSRDFRANYSEITECALQYGECIIYDGVVVNPTNYRRHERQVQSCYKCGISAWCTEQTMDSDGVMRLICEGCLSKGMPRLPGTSCGTKFCRYWECPHNANYMDRNAMRGEMNKHGQLAKKRDESRGVIDFSQPRKMVSG